MMLLSARPPTAGDLEVLRTLGGVLGSVMVLGGVVYGWRMKGKIDEAARKQDAIFLLVNTLQADKLADRAEITRLQGDLQSARERVLQLIGERQQAEFDAQKFGADKDLAWRHVAELRAQVEDAQHEVARLTVLLRKAQELARAAGPAPS